MLSLTNSKEKLREKGGGREDLAMRTPDINQL